MNESKRKVGVIGAGVMGERMMNALRTHEKFSVAAVSDVSAERAQEAAQKSGNVPWYTDYKELLAKKSWTPSTWPSRRSSTMRSLWTYWRTKAFAVRKAAR